jgi:hypothetical protein
MVKRGDCNWKREPGCGPLLCTFAECLSFDQQRGRASLQRTTNILVSLEQQGVALVSFLARGKQRSFAVTVPLRVVGREVREDVISNVQ